MTYSFKFKRPGSLSVKMTDIVSMAFIALAAALFCGANANARADLDKKPTQVSAKQAKQTKEATGK